MPLSPNLPVLLAAVALLAPPVYADRSFVKPVAQGVTLRQTIREAPNEPRILHVLEVDLKGPGVTVGVELGLDDVETDGPAGGREAVSALARRKGVAGAVNGDYFIGGSPVGLCIQDGEVVTLPMIDRTVLAVLPDGRVVFDLPRAAATVRKETASGSPVSLPLTGLNRKRGTNAFILYTPTYGPKTLTNGFGTEVVVSNVRLPLRPGRSPGVVKEVRTGRGGTMLQSGEVVLSGHGPAAAFLNSLKPGDPVEVSLRIQSPSLPDWSVVRHAVGGGPYLVREGRVSIDALEQKFKPDVVLGRAPRTAVGRTRDGRLLLVTVDGRQPLSAGMTLSEMAELMRSLGCETAMNLDGGGSTAMAAQGLRVSSPSGGSERSVAGALVVRAPALPPQGPDLPAPSPFFLYAEMEEVISSGQSVAFELRDENGGPLTNGLPIVWGVEGPIGFVDQAGYFTAGKVGTGRVMAKWGDQMATADLRVLPGTIPDYLSAAWSSPDPARPLASRLTVMVRDAHGNAIPGTRVDLTLPVGRGTADALSRPTDEKGTAMFEVAWAEAAPRRLTVKAGPVTLDPPDAPGSASTPSGETLQP